MLTTYTLSVPVFGSDGDPVAGAVITATLNKTDYTVDGAMLPKNIAGTTNSEGLATLDLVSNLIGTQNSRYQITIRSSAGSLIATATIQMPQADTNLQQLVDALPLSTEHSTAAALSASIANTKAQQTTSDAAQTAADRVATGQDRTAVAEDKTITTAARTEAVQAAERINTLYWLGV